MDFDKDKQQEQDCLISKYFSGEILPAEQEELFAWIRKDEKNKHYFNQMLNVWQVAHPAFDPQEIDVESAKMLFNKHIWPLHRFSLRRLLGVAQRVAAILFIPLLLLYVVQMERTSELLGNEAYQEVVSPFGARTEVLLPDGSRACLNSGSKLRYPVVFAHSERRVILEGEGYFEVESSEDRPFIVKTLELDVRATGTAFNVSAFATDSLVSVALVQGKVSVTDVAQNKTHMHPNSLLVLNRNTGRTKLTRVDTYKWKAWKDGVLVFRNDRLDEVFKRLEQLYNLRIEVCDVSVAAMEFHATFEGEPLERILSLVKKSADLKYESIPKSVDSTGRVLQERLMVRRK